MCMLYGLPGFIQDAALTALAGAPAAETGKRDYCATRCAVLARRSAGHPGLALLRSDAGMFMLVDVRGTGLSGYEFMMGLFRAEGVSVIDGGAFGVDTSGFIRVCFAAKRLCCARRACAFAASWRLWKHNCGDY